MTLRYCNILEASEEIHERVRVWRNSLRIRKFMISQNEIAVEEHRAWLSRLSKDGGSQIVRVAFCADVPIGIITLKDMKAGTQEKLTVPEAIRKLSSA